MLILRNGGGKEKALPRRQRAAASPFLLMHIVMLFRIADRLYAIILKERLSC